MRQAVLNDVFWAGALLGESTLLTVLCVKGRWRDYPAFSALITLPILLSLVLLPSLWLTPYTWYAAIYLGYSVLDFLLQIGIVVELAMIVLRPTGTWVHDARKQFILSACAGILLALLLAYIVAPPAPTRLEGLQLRANLFTSLLICELSIAVSLASNRLGLGWRSHVVAISQGLMVWSIVATIVDSLHSYFGVTRLYDSAEYLKSCTYLGVLWYWCVQLWREEPVREEISPKLRKFILALHERVQYDLGEAEK